MKTLRREKVGRGVFLLLMEDVGGEYLVVRETPGRNRYVCVAIPTLEAGHREFCRRLKGFRGI